MTNFYKVPDKTSLNLIPILSPIFNKVIVITGPKESGILPVGNDYVLYYNQQGEFLKQSQIHKSYIPTPTSDKYKGNTILQTTHTHILSDFISSTDICNVLLFKEEIKWKDEIIMSQNYISIWNVRNNHLKVMTIDEYFKSNK